MTQPLRAQQLRRDFVINVSNDHIIERDIDLEIEARMQSAHLFETKQALSITSTQETDSIREDSFSSDFDLVDHNTMFFQEEERYADVKNEDFDDFSSSCNPNGSSRQPIHMDTKDRIPVVVTTTTKEKTQDQGVFFHFNGGSSCSSSMGNIIPKTQNPNGFIPLRPVTSNGSSNESNTNTSLLVSTMEKQLTQLENIIQDIGSCISAVKNSSLAPAVIHELELLKKTTDQIRFRGTSAILAELGKPCTPAVGILKRLVTRAIDAHKQIDHLSMLAQGKRASFEFL